MRIRNRRVPGLNYHMVLNLTNRHIHAQVLDREAGRVIVAAHTTEPIMRNKLNAFVNSPGRYGSSTVSAAKVIGEELSIRMNEVGVSNVYWRRPGKYHGKIKSFVDAVREAGIKTYTPPHECMPKAPKHVPGVPDKQSVNVILQTTPPPPSSSPTPITTTTTTTE